MALATAVPFGLAIRGYVTHEDEEIDLAAELADPETYDEPADVEAAIQEAADEVSREWVRTQERKRELEAVVGQLVGDSPATLGSAFGALTLGMTDGALSSADEVTSHLRDLEVEHGPLWIELGVEDGVLSRITITSDEPDELLCEVLDATLSSRWGDAREGDKRWFDREAMHRAELHEDDATCALAFERYVAPAAWISKASTSAVPTWAVGQPLDTFVRRLAPRKVDLSRPAYAIEWTAPGLDEGTGPTKLTASIADGKVAAIDAVVVVTRSGMHVLEARLRQLYGEPTYDDERRVWKRTPPVTLYAIEDGDTIMVFLTVGAIPAA